MQSSRRVQPPGRLRAAAVPVHKTLDTFDQSVSSLTRASFDYLSSLEWLRQKSNVALVGPPGTGKSHLAVALGRAAVESRRVRFFRADTLVETLYRGMADNSVSRVIDGILRADLVVIDELGFSPLVPIAANHLIRLVSAAYRDQEPGAHIQLGLPAADQLPARCHLRHRHPRPLPPPLRGRHPGR